MAAQMPLRERKKAQTRQTIVRVAEELFEQHGYDNVTVAQIADAASISVKTLFVYFRSKEDLAFADTTLIDTLVDAVAAKPDFESRLAAVTKVLTEAVSTSGESGLAAFQRGFGSSDALVNGLRRLWATTEDRLTEAMADETPTPTNRLDAMRLVALVRLLTTPEALPADSADDLTALITKSAQHLMGNA